MLIGNVIGNIWATKKDNGLNGLKLLIVEPINVKNGNSNLPIVAVDIVGAGIGEKVLIIHGSVARHVANKAAVDAVIVGIIDDLEVNK